MLATGGSALGAGTQATMPGSLGPENVAAPAYASTDYTQTFSYLGEQLWYFISFYNQLSQNNNFDAITQYMGYIPGLIGIDPQLPSLKKKHFKQLQQQLSGNIYQFQQIIAKVFCETCLQDLSEYMREVGQMLHKFEKMKASFQRIPQEIHQEVKEYIDSIANEIQTQYDDTIAKLKSYWLILREKLGTLGQEYTNMLEISQPNGETRDKMEG